jgi:CelD/BcsL family acetyltransferase involved in cellulose biosynthesis
MATMSHGVFQLDAETLRSGAPEAVMGRSDEILLRIVQDEAGLRELRAAWDALLSEQSDPNPEQCFPRSLALWETVARPAGEGLFVIAGERDGRIVLLFPLVTSRAGPLRIGRLLGPHLETADMLVARDEAAASWVAAAWDLAASRFDLLRLPAISPTSHLALCIRRARQVECPSGRLLHVDCRAYGDWQAYNDAMSKSFRADCKRAWKRLAEEGEPKVLLVEDERQLGESLDWVFEHKIRSLEATGMDARPFMQKRAYYRRICSEALRSNDLVLLELWVGGRRAAAQVAFRFGDRLKGEIVTYDMALRRCAPGRLVVMETLRWAFANGIAVLELGGGQQDYKARLTDSGRDVLRYAIAATSLLGATFLRARQWLRRSRSLAAAVGTKASAALRTGGLHGPAPGGQERVRR